MKFIRRTNHEFSTTPPSRTVEEKLRKGIIVLDKPSGPTSHQATAYLKEILGVEKAGHGGTLDPKVTGVLPVALEDATKITYAILGSNKEYVAHAYFHKPLTSEDVEELRESFTGVIDQLPPVKSAVKRQWRERKIEKIDILEQRGQSVLMKILCEGGTYIRKLIHDMGEHVGRGAHMQELRRTKAGPFTEGNLVNLHGVQDYYDFYNECEDDTFEDMVLPIESGVTHLPKIIVHNSAKNSLSHGAQLNIPGVVAVTENVEEGVKVAVLSQDYKLIMIGEAMKDAENIVSKDHGQATKTVQVYLSPNEV